MAAAIIRISLLWGLAFGLLEVSYFTAVNEAFPVGASHFLAAILVGAVYAVISIVIGLAAAAVSRKFADEPPVCALMLGPALMLTVLALSHHRYRMELLSRGMAKNVASLAILVGSAIIVAILYRLLAKRAGAAKVLFVVAGCILAAIGLFQLATAGPYQSELASTATDPVEEAGGIWDTDLRVLLIGLDGGPWKVLDELMAAGKMPNLQRISARGSTANLENVIPTYSPPIWTSIATGKSSKKHGIYDHVQTSLPLGLPTVPFKVKALRTLTIPARKLLRMSDKVLHYSTVFSLSGHVRSRRVWEILEDYGLPSVVVDWYISYPVSSKSGIQVSDHFHLHRGKTGDIPGLMQPEELRARFEEMIIEPEELPHERIDYLLDVDDLDRAGRDALQEALPDWFTMVRGGMARDLTHKAIIEAALPAFPDWKFAAVYFRAMDNMHHASWQYNDLPGDDLDAHPERRFRHAAYRYYEHCDELLSTLADYVDSNTVVIVTSDHGWEDAKVAHNFAPDGFYMMAGGPVKVGAPRGRVHIYDIAPTILALLGLPTGEDMDGRPAEEMVSAEFWRNAPLRTIPTYEKETRDGDAPDLEMDEETVKELKALGYIN